MVCHCSVHFLLGYLPKRPANFHQGLDSQLAFLLWHRVSHEVRIKFDQPRLKESNNCAASVCEIPKLLSTLNLSTRLRGMSSICLRSNS